VVERVVVGGSDEGGEEQMYLVVSAVGEEFREGEIGEKKQHLNPTDGVAHGATG